MGATDAGARNTHTGLATANLRKQATMVKTITNRACAQNKSLAETFSPGTSPTYPALIDGVVQHELVSPGVQIAILEIVDETGSATIGDLAQAIPNHIDVPGAVLALASAGLLTLDFVGGILDANTVVRRATFPGPEGTDPTDGAARDVSGPQPVRARGNGAGQQIFSLPVTAFHPAILVAAASERRVLAKTPELQKPGVYILFNRDEFYVGFGKNTGARIGQGNQPIENVSSIVAITDRNDQLEAQGAKALERIMWSRLSLSGLTSTNSEPPEGPALDPQRYSELEALAGQVCLSLWHNEMLFDAISPRLALAGPVAEPGAKAPRRAFNEVPVGEILELRFCGMTALAAKQADDRWILLRGSDVRLETAPSADPSIIFKRSAFLHAGQLGLTPDGESYVALKDIVFSSGTAIAQFCCGSKGRRLSSWTPVEPDAGHDPDMSAPIAA